MKIKQACINQNKDCVDWGLDLNYECAACQEKFTRRMKKVQKDTENSNKIEEGAFMDRIPNRLIYPILKEASELYKIKFRGKAGLVDYLNEKYDTTLTSHILTRLSELMPDYGLTWKYTK